VGDASTLLATTAFVGTAVGTGGYGIPNRQAQAGAVSTNVSTGEQVIGTATAALTGRHSASVVRAWGAVAITKGSGTTSITWTVRLRRGTSTSGTLIATATATSALASDSFTISLEGFDALGATAGQYVVTVQGSAANGVVTHYQTTALEVGGAPGPAGPAGPAGTGGGGWTSVLDYGALGNNSHIDGPNIKAALEAADDVYCPPGVYLFDIGQLLQIRGKRLFGAPGKTIFRHIGTATDQAANAFFYLGNMHPYWFDNRNVASEKFKRFAVTGAVAKGARVLTLSATPSGADATDMGPGKMVWVRHATEYPRTGWAQPDYCQLMRVENLAGATLTLESPVNEPISSALVSPVGTDRADGYLSSVLAKSVVAGTCEDCVFEDIIFEGGSETFSRGGAYRCTLRNIEHRKGLWGPLFNAFVQCKISGYKCQFSTWAMEVKMATSETIFEGLHFTYRPITGVTLGGGWSSDNNTGTVVYPIDIGERSNRLTFRDLRLNIGPEWTGVQRTMDVSDAWNITFEDPKFDVSGGGDAPLLGIRGNADTTGPGSLYPTRNVLYAHGEWNVGISKNQNAALYGTSPALVLTGIRFIGNRWTGAGNNSAQHMLAASYCTDWTVIGDRCSTGMYMYAQRASACLPPKAAGNLIGFTY
jgi:hypothetical protein